jgi:hypothetical protein
LREDVDLRNSLLGEVGEYGVGGLSAMDDATLDFLRTRSGLRIELEGDLRGGARSSGDGVRGASYVWSSFSNIVGEIRSRVTTGRIPYFSVLCVY